MCFILSRRCLRSSARNLRFSSFFSFSSAVLPLYFPPSSLAEEYIVSDSLRGAYIRVSEPLPIIGIIQPPCFLAIVL